MISDRDRNTPWTALVVLSALAAWGLWSLATHEPEPRKVRIIDLPPVTEAALLGSGIDRQTLSEYLELKTSVQMGSAPSTASTLSTPVLMLATQKEVIPPVPAGRTKPLSPAKHLVQTARGTTLSRAPNIGEWAKVEISTYSARYHGMRTATGERYDHHEGHTAATTVRGRKWALPKGSVWEVEYPAEKNIVLKPGMTVAHDFETGKTTRVVTVRINDTGSWRPKRAPYWLDLSGAAWRDLTGIAPSRKVARMRRVR